MAGRTGGTCCRYRPPPALTVRARLPGGIGHGEPTRSRRRGARGAGRPSGAGRGPQGGDRSIHDRRRMRPRARAPRPARRRCPRGHRLRHVPARRVPPDRRGEGERREVAAQRSTPLLSRRDAEPPSRRSRAPRTLARGRSASRPTRGRDPRGAWRWRRGTLASASRVADALERATCEATLASDDRSCAKVPTRAALSRCSRDAARWRNVCRAPARTMRTPLHS